MLHSPVAAGRGAPMACVQEGGKRPSPALVPLACRCRCPDNPPLAPLQPEAFSGIVDFWLQVKAPWCSSSGWPREPGDLAGKFQIRGPAGQGDLGKQPLACQLRGSLGSLGACRGLTVQHVQQLLLMFATRDIDAAALQLKPGHNSCSGPNGPSSAG